MSLISKKTVVGLGEVLWDVLPDGRKLGGAPTNVAYHAHALGDRGHLISAVGDDALGVEICEALDAMGVERTCVQVDSTRPTGTVDVTLNESGSASYVIHEGVAWDALEATPEALALAGCADAICFGSLAQRSLASREAIQRIVSATPASALRVFDINLRPPHVNAPAILEALNLATIFKINDDELPRLAEMADLPEASVDELQPVLERFDLQMVALTCGAEGCRIAVDGQMIRCPAPPTTVADTVGAGDSFTSALILGVLAGWPVEEVAAFASDVAAYVCTQHGGTPALPESLRARFSG